MIHYGDDDQCWLIDVDSYGLDLTGLTGAGEAQGFWEINDFIVGLIKVNNRG